MAFWRIVFDMLGWMFLVLKIMYDRWPWFYLAVTRWVYSITNPETIWDMSIRFHGSFPPDALDKIMGAMSSCDNGFVVKADTAFRKELWIKRTLFELTSCEDPAVFQPELDMEPGNSIHIQMREKEITYRTSMQYIDHFLAPMLEEIERQVSPSSANYSLNVVFRRPNPFFGLYVRRLKLSHVADFHVTFHVNSIGSGACVEILKDALQITSPSLSVLMATSRQYLCLSPGGMD